METIAIFALLVAGLPLAGEAAQPATSRGAAAGRAPAAAGSVLAAPMSSMRAQASAALAAPSADDAAAGVRRVYSESAGRGVVAEGDGHVAGRSGTGGPSLSAPAPKIPPQVLERMAEAKTSVIHRRTPPPGQLSRDLDAMGVLWAMGVGILGLISAVGAIGVERILAATFFAAISVFGAYLLGAVGPYLAARGGASQAAQLRAQKYLTLAGLLAGPIVYAFW